MGDFFKPWRRKIGVVTLVFACLVAGGWVRSLTVREVISIPLQDSEEIFFWFLVVPLTLLSAYLLLVKPRVAKPKTIVDNCHSE